MKESHRTGCLWLVLFAMIAAAGSLVEGRDPTWHLPWVAAAATVVFVLFVVLRLLTRTSRRAAELNETGRRHLGLGRPAAALESFRAAEAVHRRPVHRLNVAIAELELFRIDAALEVLEAAATDSRFAPWRALVVEQRTMARLFRGTATEGDIEPYVAMEAPVARLFLALFSVRKGRFREADGILSDPIVKLLGGWRRGLVDILAAWCALELRGEVRAVDRPALFGAAEPDELFRHWPELRDFLDRAK